MGKGDNNLKRLSIKCHKNQLYNCAMAFFSIIIICSIGVYCFTPATNSDYVEGLYWADASIQATSILSPDFIYPYAIPVGANILLIPFVHLLGISQLANALGMFLFYIIMVITAFSFMKAITDNFVKAVIGTALIILAFRSRVGTNLLHHILFYQLGFICFMGMMGSTIKMIKTVEMGGCKDSKKNSLIMLLFAIWSGVNGLPTILLASVPVVISIFVIVYLKDKAFKRSYRLLAVVFVGTIVGYIVYSISIRGISESGYIEEVGSYSFLSIQDWIKNLSSIPELWIKTHVIHNPEGVRFYTTSGIEVGISILVAVFTAIIPFWFALRHNNETEDALVFVGVIVIWLICFAEFVLFRKTQVRILYNGICANYVLIGVVISKQSDKSSGKMIASFLCFIVLLLYAILFPLKANWKNSTSIIDELEKHGLHYGFGTYWNSNINTVNSEEKIKIRAITIEDGLVYPYYYQSHYSWYETTVKSGSDDWFILLSDSEYNDFVASDENAIQDLCREEFVIPDVEYIDMWENDCVDSFHVLVFPIDAWPTVINVR